MGWGTCSYCGSTWQTQNDHIKPQSKGGVTTTPCCRRCNQSKGAKTLVQWFRWLRDNDPYRWNKVVNYNYGRCGSIPDTVARIRDE